MFSMSEMFSFLGALQIVTANNPEDTAFDYTTEPAACKFSSFESEEFV